MDDKLDRATSPIEGVALYDLKVFSDHRGAVLHHLRSDAAHFHGFGESYLSETNPGVIKAWKRHHRITQHMAVPVGRMQFVLFDGRPGTATSGNVFTCVLGRPDAYKLLIIPPLVCYGFQCISDSPGLIVNAVTHPHDPNESETIPVNSPAIPYVWG